MMPELAYCQMTQGTHFIEPSLLADAVLVPPGLLAGSYLVAPPFYGSCPLPPSPASNPALHPIAAQKAADLHMCSCSPLSTSFYLLNGSN